MKLRQLGGKHAYVLEIGSDEILFSYQTPVAFVDRSSYPCKVRRTDKFFSVTTSKHVNKFVEGWDQIVQAVPQEEIERFVDERPAAKSILLPEVEAKR